MKKKNYINWTQLAKKELKNNKLEILNSKTPDGINIKPLYTAEDLKNLEGMTINILAKLANAKILTIDGTNN